MWKKTGDYKLNSNQKNNGIMPWVLGRKFADQGLTFDGDLSLGRVLAMGVDSLSLVGSRITGLHLATKWLYCMVLGREGD
jgi:hypothetical protein